MAENVTEQHSSDLKSSLVFSLVCDESCDVKLTLIGRLFLLWVFMKNYWVYYRSEVKMNGIN
jgi:hypothetical protein